MGPITGTNITRHITRLLPKMYCRLTFSRSCFRSSSLVVTSEAVSGVNTPAMVMITERRKKDKIAKTLFLLVESLCQ
jgi:hypothetical protein